MSHRSDLLTRIGLRASSPLIPAPNHAGYYIIVHFLLAYVFLSTRGVKFRLGLDHNENPRHDLTNFGEAAVKSGKLTRAQFNAIQRQEAAHQNAVEHFPFFVGAVLLATHAGLPGDMVNRYAMVYTIARVAYAILYVRVETKQMSWFRTACWWAGNITCIRLCYKATGALNSILGKA